MGSQCQTLGERRREQCALPAAGGAQPAVRYSDNMGNRGKLKIWNHWFWITLISGSMIRPGSGKGMLVEPHEDITLVSFPISQNVEREGEPDMVVSKAMSVSKVSVKRGDVTEEVENSRQDRSLNGLGNALLDSALYDIYDNVASLPIVNPRVTTQPPETFLRQLLEQLQQVASVNVGSGAQLSDYQLVYKDEVAEDYYSDYSLDHLSDEYLDYLYQIYDDLDNEITYYDDDTEYVDNDAAAHIAVNRDNDDLSGAISRSGAAEGRVLDTEKEEDIAEPEGQLFENVVPPVSEELPAGTVVNKLEYVDKFLNMGKEETREGKTETTIEDFVVDVELKSTNNNSDIYIKIGIFITVSLAVLIMTGGLIFVMMRRKIKTVAESSLVTKEGESNSINNQVVFQRGLKTSTTSSLQEHFNNHFGKSGAAYLYDDLHSLDNDSFLTSLETISEKDRFDWE